MAGRGGRARSAPLSGLPATRADAGGVLPADVPSADPRDPPDDDIIIRAASVALGAVHHPHLDHDDARQVAMIAAWRSLAAWRPRGASRLTFASRWAIMAVRRAEIDEVRRVLGRRGQRRPSVPIREWHHPTVEDRYPTLDADSVLHLLADLDPDPVQLHAIAAVAECGSQREAATVLGVSESRVSQILRPLRRPSP